MTLLLTTDIIFKMVSFLFSLHCLLATRCSLNILPLEEKTSQVSTETEMDKQLIQGVAGKGWKKKQFSEMQCFQENKYRKSYLLGEKIKDIAMYNIDLMSDVTCSSQSDEKMAFLNVGSVELDYSTAILPNFQNGEWNYWVIGGKGQDFALLPSPVSQRLCYLQHILFITCPKWNTNTLQMLFKIYYCVLQVAISYFFYSN